jgi:excisionase family DNA binding protein
VPEKQWLTIGEALARLRAEGFTESESTIRRMVDDGEVESYRTRRGHRRVDAASLAALIARRGRPE